ncbi:hypothetical protein [Burkholderia plantarii]|uniref:hypothetical protein n=1 Tax=Burkholderia plantarii TaxID=41899 RepID=UPI0018DC09AD|nr:hypothetical protein [Burkholderia plantarii]MBI0329794.1 hypothetical protein [Burkholderia plantarii]
MPVIGFFAINRTRDRWRRGFHRPVHFSRCADDRPIAGLLPDETGYPDSGPILSSIDVLRHDQTTKPSGLRFIRPGRRPASHSVDTNIEAMNRRFAMPPSRIGRASTISYF